MDNFKMKDMAECERPYEKCISAGPEVLTDAELLAVILRSGSKGQNALVTAQKILNAHGLHKGIIGLNYLTLEELTGIEGIGMVKAVQMKCIAELSKRMARSTYKPLIAFESPDSIADYYMEDTRYIDQEEVFVLLFDTRHKLLKEKRISEGTINHAAISPREIFIFALEYHAKYIIIVHNHPSGDPEPSAEDILLTHRVLNAGRMIGIELSDHIIIGNNCFVSLLERGYIDNETS